MTRSSPAAVGPATRARARRVLWCAAAVGGFAQSLAGAAGALLAAEVSRSDAAAGAPQAALVAGSAIAAVGMSAIAGRRGRRTALASGAAAAVVGCTLVLVSAPVGSLPGVLAGSLLLGAGNTAVMLTRYAAADLVGERSRAAAMAAVLVATTVGAVLGPNLLAPAGRLGAALDVPALAGPYLLAGAAFAVASLMLVRGLPPASRPADGHVGLTATVSPTSRGLGRDATAGLAVLGVANLVMVAVMTMAPVQLHHLGHGLTTIGAVVSAHIAAMFGPSLLSGWITDRFGAHRAVAAAGALLAAASGLAAVRPGSLAVLAAAMVVLGAGWNLALISGSVLLTADVPVAARPRREGWGEVSMGFAAAGGGVTAGPLVVAGGYRALALAGALTAALLVAAMASRGRTFPSRRDAR